MSPPLLLCYQLSQLLAFYQSLVSNIIGPGAQLSLMLQGALDMARRTFFEQLRASGDQLLRSPPPPPQDISPPSQVGVFMGLNLMDDGWVMMSDGG